MDWQDEAIVLAARHYGEHDAVLTLLTREHGRHLGLLRGGFSRRQRPIIELGNRLQANWRARLPEQLGNYQIEGLQSVAALLLDQPLRLAALASACAVIDTALPEREPHPEIFVDLDILIARLIEEVRAGDDARGNDGWLVEYVRWELTLLADLGFGLDLTHCAVTGETEGLSYVSPKTGRSVTRSAGQGYHDRLLPLPAFLAEDHTARPDRAAILDGLRLTGHFLARHVFAQTGSSPGSGNSATSRQSSLSEGPMARRQFLQRLQG
ncbi:DNA repair protein RecO [Dongia soli]|uniref:DNA repair protein RecO n=1 Tax=Dongia soli TaxID=600628 RepID=A0ABU5EE66_9PROT|nr:DNA repair protein RecO [Dongia soli]MDY0884124.1 DNA repair protein RecO [Dongia soli]